jgi:hypothetical protein
MLEQEYEPKSQEQGRKRVDLLEAASGSTCEMSESRANRERYEHRGRGGRWRGSTRCWSRSRDRCAS